MIADPGGVLDLRIDPRGMFNAVEFSALSAIDGTFAIPNSLGGVGGALLNGVAANSGVYEFTFSSSSSMQ